MRLSEVLDRLNSLEKNSFIKIIDSLTNESPKNKREIDRILAQNDGDLKHADSLNVSRVFQLLDLEYQKHLLSDVQKSSIELELVVEILIRDGNCLLNRDWFSKLIDIEFREFAKRIKGFQVILKEKPKDLDVERYRDYHIYKECVHTAFFNDLEYSQEPKITNDEKSILITLAKNLELSDEEVRLIEASIVGFKKPEIDNIIKDLKDFGIILHVKKDNLIYVPDEIVRLLRRMKGKYIADKFFRRVLRHLQGKFINLLVKKHNINKKLPTLQKIESIINKGVSFRGALLTGIHKPGTPKTSIKNVIINLIENNLKVDKKIPGNTAEAKLDNLVEYFDDLDKDPKVIISIDGYDKLLIDLIKIVPRTKNKVTSQFQLQDREDLFISKSLLDYNIKPRDVLYLLEDSELRSFCHKQGIKTRGDLIYNILKKYKDASNLYIENYDQLAHRDWKGLKENGINIKEAEIGVKFEDITKLIFKKLGFNVDESLRRKINTKKDKIDIVLNVGSNNLILVECKSHKGGNFGKYASVSRQIKAYNNLAKKNGFTLLNSLLVAPDFTDEFIKDCGLEIDLSLSLITASSLNNILDGFKKTSLNKLPHTLFTRDVVIKEDRILKAILK